MSVDVKSDGPCIISNSITEFSVVAISDETGHVIDKISFYLERRENSEVNEVIKKRNMEHIKNTIYENLEVIRVPPKEAMKRLSLFCEDLFTRYNLIWVGWPANYDWAFLRSYFLNYKDEDSAYVFPYNCRCIQEKEETLFNMRLLDEEKRKSIKNSIKIDVLKEPFKELTKSTIAATIQGKIFFQYLKIENENKNRE